MPKHEGGDTLNSSIFLILFFSEHAMPNLLKITTFDSKLTANFNTYMNGLSLSSFCLYQETVVTWPQCVLPTSPCATQFKQQYKSVSFSS